MVLHASATFLVHNYGGHCPGGAQIEETVGEDSGRAEGFGG
jgi:hypothetical protein